MMPFQNGYHQSVNPRRASSVLEGDDEEESERVTLRDFQSYNDYVCGFGAAIVNIYVTFPINKLIFRQIVHGMSVKSATANLRAEGFRHLYRGVGPPLIQRSVTLSLMFGTFGTYRMLLERYGQDVVPSDRVRFCLAAFFAGSTEAILCPFERVQMLLQDDRQHHRYQNTIDAFRKLRSHGFLEYYRGITAILLRNGPSNILFFSLRDHVRGYLSPSGSHSSIGADLWRDFLSGSCVGAVISTLFYPVNVIRTRMQTEPPGTRHLSLWRASVDIYHQRDGNLRKLMRGVHINYSRSFLSWGIINACYELFHRGLDHTDSERSMGAIRSATPTVIG